MNIKTVDKKYLQARCDQRCYTIEEVDECVIAKNGDMWTIDTSHEKYPSLDKSKCTKIDPHKYIKQQTVSYGPGTELKKLLSRIGIKANPNCSCNARANIMNQKGIEWCEQNINEIVEWLKEEAAKRKLPFIDYAGKLLVKRAINNAKTNKQNTN